MSQFDARRSPPRYLPRILVAIAGLAALGAGWRLTSGGPSTTTPLDAVAMAALQSKAFAEAEARPGFARPESVPVEVRSGETFEHAVQRAGVAPDEAREAVAALSSAIDTVNIKAGMAFDAAIAKPRGQLGPARLIGLSLRTGPASALTLSRTFDGALRLRELDEKIRNVTTVADGELHGSLYESAERAGADPSMIAQVVTLFSHKLDFARDIQAGDHFSLVFDRTVTESGRTVETGNLRYAEIEANGQVTRFYAFERDGKIEFFDEAGKNIKGFLLHTPVDGARITSAFGMRNHPVLGYTRMHQGIDFGAGMGTPVLAAGDGVVVEARRWGGYGNWLRIRHSGGWETGYGHLSRYAAGLRPGMHVSQGQLVAYVGSTGVATGPHLHYEVWLKGARINPAGAKVPQGTELAGAELARFNAQKTQIDGLRLAAARTTPATTLASSAAGLKPSL
jgi:murein DD-endopeptidase MepM/ murein hydrolase activator NlpD